MRGWALFAIVLVGCADGGAADESADSGATAGADARVDSSADAPLDLDADGAIDGAPDAPADVATYSCPTTAFGGPYTLVPTVGAVSDRPAAAHPDLNVKIRGFVPTGGTLGLVDVGGPTDDKAPRLYTLLQDAGTPTFAANFKVNDWDWSAMKVAGPIADPPVTLTAYATTEGQAIRLPRSGYQIAPGLQARALFLDADSITLKYTSEDNVVYGYTIHVLDLCVDPALAKAYGDAVAKGRTSLPALAAGQVFAKARGASVRVTIRDTGSFMDPRVKKDWYQP
ncbi:MAG: hypothetical protein HYV09_11455 [Deltaproteobacteria bacterium]|nr:hypothetical protein [Deltaproteobacteria bacterium]